MITKDETFKKAFEIKSKSLKKKQAEYNMYLKSAYSSNPRLEEIDRLLSSIGASLALTALSGDTEKINDLQSKASILSLEKKAILNKCEIKDIHYDCQICLDTGYVNGRICECVKKLANMVMAEEMTREMPLKNSTFELFDLNYYPDSDDSNGINSRRRMTSIYNVCKNYAENFNPIKADNLLFMGQTGLGKTHLTLAIVSSVIEKGYTPIYGPCENLFSQIEAEKFTGANRGAYESMVKCDLLVIDDLGAEMATSFTKSALYNLINSRLLSRKPTIINTNLTMKEIEQRYTARISSRLIGSYNAYKFLGTDIRQQKIINEKSKR